MLIAEGYIRNSSACLVVSSGLDTTLCGNRPSNRLANRLKQIDLDITGHGQHGQGMSAGDEGLLKIAPTFVECLEEKPDQA